MRKLISLLAVLLLVFSCAAAEPAVSMITLDFGDFTMDIREDAIGSTAETIEENVPFVQIFQDYDPAASFNKNLNCVWTNDVPDLAALNVDEYVQYIVAMTMQQYDSMGITATEPMLYNAGLDEHDGKQALTYMYSVNMDYSGMGVDIQMTLYTIQAAVPIEGAGTYTFTISTDDPENIGELMDIMNSIRWAD